MKEYEATEIAYKNGYEQGQKDAHKETASFEAEHRELIQEREILMAKMDFLRSEKESLETELVRLRAQMDVVYLIFGKSN